MLPHRHIIHIDMDAFFASVEQRDNPDLRGKPVAVGGSGNRGVVAAASYEARQYGVRSAMPGISAQRLCPSLIFVKPRFDAYKAVSDQIRAIFHDYTPLVEPLSLDEAYLELTDEHPHTLEGTALIAEAIRQRIADETGLTASAGVSINKFLAKVASDINKPNGLKVITQEEAIPFLEALPIHKFHGIGKVTASKMERMGIYCGADLKRYEELDLIKRFGKAGRHFYRIVRADDRRRVSPDRIRKSIGAERTYSTDITDLAEMRDNLVKLAQRIHEHMQRSDNYGRTLTLKIKSPDFKIITRSRSFPSELHSLADIVAAAHQLLAENEAEISAVRLLGLSASNLSREQAAAGQQLTIDFPSP